MRKAALLAGLIYLAACAAVWLGMRQPPAAFLQAASWTPTGLIFATLPVETLWKSARAGSLRPGDPAPDFDLPTADGAARIRLSSHRGVRPVLLAFGSYTWPPFRREVPELNRIYREWRDRAAFYVVYIHEAHPSNLWQDALNVRDGILVRNPFTSGERHGLAQSCVRNLGIELPALVDGMDNATEAAYTAWPDRLYVIDRPGRVSYKSAAGPYGFRPKDAEAALRKAISTP